MTVSLSLCTVDTVTIAGWMDDGWMLVSNFKDKLDQDFH